MTIPEAADLIARNAVPLLLALSVLALGAAALLWHIIERYAPRLVLRVAPLWRRLDRRGLAARYLGVHAIASFAVAGAATYAFVELADEISPDEELGQFDLALSRALGETLSPATLRFFAKLTHLGDFNVLAPLVAAVAVLLFVRRERIMAAALVIITGGAALLNDTLKSVFARARPEFVHGFTEASGFSFPSGHSAGSLAVYGTLAYVAVRLVPRAWRVPCVALAMLLIVFVGASRILLQVHFASDVLGGWACAATWTSLCIAGLEAWRLGLARRAPAAAEAS
jgi:membrane-associated phospholipid phosphatase